MSGDFSRILYPHHERHPSPWIRKLPLLYFSHEPYWKTFNFTFRHFKIESLACRMQGNTDSHVAAFSLSHLYYSVACSKKKCLITDGLLTTITYRGSNTALIFEITEASLLHLTTSRFSLCATDTKQVNDYFSSWENMLRTVTVSCTLEADFSLCTPLGSKIVIAYHALSSPRQYPKI